MLQSDHDGILNLLTMVVQVNKYCLHHILKYCWSFLQVGTPEEYVQGLRDFNTNLVLSVVQSLHERGIEFSQVVVANVLLSQVKKLLEKLAAGHPQLWSPIIIEAIF